MGESLDGKNPTPAFIADLYAAALEKDELSDLAALIGGSLGVNSVGIWAADKQGIFDMGVHGIIAETGSTYIGHFSKLDIWNQNLQRMPFDKVVLACDHTSEQALAKTEFYNDFARHFGLFRPMGARLQLGASTVATVALEQAYTRRLFEEHDKTKLKRLIPFLKGALQLRQRQRRPRLDVRSAALSALAFGAVICAADGRIVFANTAAEELSNAGAGVVLGDRRRGVGAYVPGESRTLRSLICDAANSGPGGSIRLTGADGIAALLALVTPLPANLGGDQPGFALVALRSKRSSAAFKEKTLTALFRLSPAQAAIAFAIYSGRNLEDIATERAVSVTTVRTHLQEIFVRTGTDNQRSLIRLLALIPQVR